MIRKDGCSICRRKVQSRALNPAYPFCSMRCRQVDLGRWLGEEYRVADPRAEDAGDGTPTDDVESSADPHAEG